MCFKHFQFIVTNLRGQKLYQAFSQKQRCEIRNQSQEEKWKKSTNVWSPNNMLLKSQRVNEEINDETRKYPKTNQHGDRAFRKLWDAAKAILRRKFITMQAHSETKKNLKNSLACYL